MNKISFYKQLKKRGPTGLVIGFFALLLCELPIVLALLGLGSIGSITNALSPSFGLQITVYIVVILVSLVLITIFVMRMWRRDKPDVE